MSSLGQSSKAGSGKESLGVLAKRVRGVDLFVYEDVGSLQRLTYAAFRTPYIAGHNRHPHR